MTFLKNLKKKKRKILKCGRILKKRVVLYWKEVVLPRIIQFCVNTFAITVGCLIGFFNVYYRDEILSFLKEVSVFSLLLKKSESLSVSITEFV